MTNPVQDNATVNSSGISLEKLPEGVTFHNVVTHPDDRGAVCEMFDPRWNWHPDPIVFVYTFSIRPGIIKGWGLHKLHDDRYFILFGEVEVVLYDARPDSATKGSVSKIVLSEYQRRLMNIPAGVWHADNNIGTKDAVIVNFPTIQYNHASPDKYRLPLDTDEIPYKFPNPRGG